MFLRRLKTRRTICELYLEPAWCSGVGVIFAEYTFACVYIVKMGWEFTTDEAGEKTLMRRTTFNTDALDAEYPAQGNFLRFQIVQV